jgi:ribosomal protein S18
MATLQQSASGKKDGDIRYLTPLNIETNKQKKYCRFKKSGIKYVDYKDADFLIEIRQRARQDPSASSDWNFIEISKKSVCSRETCSSLSVNAICG